MNQIKKIYNLAIYDKALFWVTTFVQVISSVLSIANSLLYGNLVSMVANGKTFGEMSAMIILTSVSTIACALLFWLANYMDAYMSDKNIFQLRNRFINKLLATKYSLISTEDSSKYINNLTVDVTKVIHIYANCGSYFFVNVVTVVVSFFASVILDWRIALSMLGFTVIMGILPIFIKKPLDKSIYKMSESNKEYIRSLKENLLGVSIIKNNNAEDICEKSIFDYNAKDFRRKKSFDFINSLAGGISTFIQSIATLCLILFTCFLVTVNVVQVGAVLSIYSIGMTFYGSILGCSWVVTQLVSIKSIREVVEDVIERETEEAGEKLVFKDAIEMKNVSFQYKDSERKILDNINLTINKNGKYLIIGKSGSGKSTILKLLCKFYSPIEGNLTFDGAEYENFSERDINSSIAYCQQAGYLFNRSLKDNIDFKYSDDTDKLEEIIRLVKLEDFVEKLPNKLDTVIDEEVNQVSGGEKLRINLARSLFRDSDIILLDEITSALDKKTSEIIEKNVLQLDKTVVNVCHKFNDDTLKLYDRIFIVEDGKIVEEGISEELQSSERFMSYRNIK